MNWPTKEPQNVRELFEIQRFVSDRMLPLMGMNNVEKVLLEGDIDVLRQELQQTRDLLAAKKQDLADTITQIEVAKEKARAETAPIHQRAHTAINNAVKVYEAVKDKAGDVEKKWFEETLKKANKAVAA